MRYLLTIAHTWSGEPIPPGEQVLLELRFARNHLQIDFTAPWYRDPAPTYPPGPSEDLWNFEVVELFLFGPGAPGQEPYLELEFGPHGHHLAWLFRGPRQRVGGITPEVVKTRRGQEVWSCRARIGLENLPAPNPDALSINAFAMHGRGAERRFLACAPVCGAQPDFHRYDAAVPLSRFAAGSKEPPVRPSNGRKQL